MANRRPSVATTFLAILGLGALAVAIVAIALSLTASAAGRVDADERAYAAVELQEQRHAVAALLAAEQAATVLDQINGDQSMAAAPLTAQRVTAYESAAETLSDLGDRADTVGAESQRWLSGMSTATEPTAVDDHFDQLVAYHSIVDTACCIGVVPSDEHHVDDLRTIEAAATISTSNWDYFYVAIETASRRGPGIPPEVSRFVEHLGVPSRLPQDSLPPSEQLAADLASFVTLGLSQETVNTFLSSDAVTTLDRVVGQAAGQPGAVVTVDEAYAAADAVYRSVDEFFIDTTTMTKARLLDDVEAANSIQLVTRVVAPILLIALIGLGYLTYRFARNRERALQREQDLLDARNRFMRMVSHELRTPATAISGFAEMLGSDWTALTEAEIAEFLAIINRQSTHLSLLVDDLLTLSHLETGRLRLHMGVVNLQQATEDAIALVDARYGIDVETTIDPSLTLLADPDRLVQIMRNLVENAAKYGKTGISVSAAVVGPLCEIVVSDTGAGVPPEYADRIFRFWDRGAKDGNRIRGYGMGLAIARHLAQAMMGDLLYRSHEPVGSEFVLSLSVGPPDVKNTPDRSPETSAVG